MSKLPGNDPVAAEIQAEIADHLATATEKLQSQGIASNEAREKSEAKFGDAATIGRRCYWIKQGDFLMFHTATIVLLTLLCCALGVMAFNGHRSQRQMAEQMTALAEQLKALAERPIVQSQPSEHPPQEITGQAYVGSPTLPVKNKEVMIVNATDGSIVRRVLTDDDGKYRSGPLGAGDYCLVSSVATQSPLTPYFPYIQTAPIYVYPGLPAPGHDFDVAEQAGRLAIELSRELPSLRVDDKYTIESRLLIEVATAQKRSRFWTSSMPMPPAWPLRLSSVTASDRGPSFSPRFLELLAQEDLKNQHEATHFGDQFGLLPTGEATVVAAVIADVIPLGYQPPQLAIVEATFGSRTDSTSIKRQVFKDRAWQSAQAMVSGGDRPIAPSNNPPTLENDRFFWMTKGLGQLWLKRLSPDETEPAPPPQPFTLLQSTLSVNARSDWTFTVPIISGSITRLRVEVPADIEAKIKELIATTTEAQEFWKYTLGDNSPPPIEMQQELNQGSHPFFRKVKITVLGTEPLDQGPAK